MEPETARTYKSDTEIIEEEPELEKEDLVKVQKEDSLETVSNEIVNEDDGKDSLGDWEDVDAIAGDKGETVEPKNSKRESK